MVLSLYALGMLMMIVCGLVLRKTAFREGDSPFLMELPPYRVPHARSVLKRLWDRAKDFLTRAGTLIFAMSVLIWFLQSFTPSLSWTTDSAASIFGRIGAFIAPVFAPLGFGQWEKGVALLSGLVAKEAVVSTLQVLYSAGGTAELTQVIAATATRVSAYAFLVFILLYVPCVAALAAAKRELRSTKYFIMTICIRAGRGLCGDAPGYQIGRLFAADRRCGRGSDVDGGACSPARCRGSNFQFEPRQFCPRGKTAESCGSALLPPPLQFPLKSCGFPGAETARKRFLLWKWDFPTQKAPSPTYTAGSIFARGLRPSRALPGFFDCLCERAKAFRALLSSPDREQGGKKESPKVVSIEVSTNYRPQRSSPG